MSFFEKLFGSAPEPVEEITRDEMKDELGLSEVSDSDLESLSFYGAYYFALFKLGIQKEDFNEFLRWRNMNHLEKIKELIDDDKSATFIPVMRVAYAHFVEQNNALKSSEAHRWKYLKLEELLAKAKIDEDAIPQTEIIHHIEKIVNCYKAIWILSNGTQLNTKQVATEKYKQLISALPPAEMPPPSE